MKFLKKRKNRTNCLPLQELLKMEVPKDVECDYLAEFVKTSRNFSFSIILLIIMNI